MIHVLIVDDKAENRYLLRTMLQAYQARVTEARNGIEALDQARLQKPDLVISDLLMPGMDGYTLLREWKADDVLRHVPFIVYTATYTEPQDERLALDLGADAFILKPAEPEDFLARLGQVVAGGTPHKLLPTRDPQHEDEVLLRSYNETLVRKLEHRTLQLDQTNRVLAAKEARLRAILDTEPECVMLVDRSGAVIDINTAGLSFFQADSIDGLGEGLLPRTEGSHRDRLGEMLRAVLSGENRRLELESRGLAGGHCWLEIHATPFQNDSGDTIAALCVAKNITARKQAEDSLWETNERLQLAVRAGKVGLWDWDLRTNQVTFSPEWKRQLGYEPEEVADAFDEWKNRLHPDDRDASLMRVQSFLDSERSDYKSEFRLRHRDGSYRHILSRAADVRGTDGERLRLIGSHVDITEHVSLQSQLTQAQKMESIGQLAGGIAHDFNNLLTIINGTADIALMELDGTHPLASHLGEIQQAGRRAASLTRQLLAFSRRQIIKPAILDLNDVIKGMWKMLRRLIGEHVVLSFSPGDPLGSILVDPGHIEQILVNLAVNAQDAMPDGGSLTIETRNVLLDQAYATEHPSVQPGHHVMLAISDTGVGMDDATRQRIFEPFFTTKELGKGTGLGLATVYGIVKQSGGSISVYSEPGLGTTFRLYFPQQEQSITQHAGGTLPPARGGHESILIVEDEAAVREVARRALESAGYTVTCAGNGEEAIRLLEDGTQVQLVLTDVVMPVMNGRELADHVARKHPGVKVLFSSGYTDDAILRHRVLDKGVHFLGKPYSMDELLRTVRQVLDGERG